MSIPPAAGAQLRRARIEQGRDLDEIAAGLQVPSRFLADLEAGDFDAFGTTLHAEAHLRLYARALGLDPDQLLGAERADEPQEPATIAADEEAGAPETSEDDETVTDDGPQPTGIDLSREWPTPATPRDDRRRMTVAAVGIFLAGAVTVVVIAMLGGGDETELGLAEQDDTEVLGEDVEALGEAEEGDEGAEDPTDDTVESSSADGARGANEASTDADDETSAGQSDEASDGDEAEPEPEPEARPPEEIRVQLLNASRDTERVLDAEETLRAFGYEIVLSDVTAAPYEQSQVWYVEGARAEAEALVDTDDRFGQIEPDPGLAAEVDLHVVVGSDWPPES